MSALSNLQTFEKIDAMKTRIAIALLLAATMCICTGCRDGVLECITQKHVGYDYEISILKINYDEDLTDHIIMFSLRGYNSPPESPMPLYPLGCSPYLHDNYFFKTAHGCAFDFYVLSLSYSDIKDSNEAWLENNWQDYVMSDVKITDCCATVISSCRYDDNYYKDMPFIVRGESSKEDCLYDLGSFIPKHYISREIMNQMIDNGTIFGYFSKYDYPTNTDK
jgi:hypothetical protein